MASEVLYQESSTSEIIIIISGSIGYICSIFVSIALVLHVIFQICRVAKSSIDESTVKNKSGYILITIYLFTTIMIGLIYCFVRSNMFTGLNVSQFNQSRCLSGVILGYIFGGSNYMLLNIIFLHRVYLSFKGSAFAYRTCTYRVLFICIIFIVFPLIIIIISASGDDTFTFYYDPNTLIGFCASGNITDTSVNFVSITVVIAAIMQPLISIALLFMFVKGLWILNKQMMETFLQDRIEMDISKSTTPQNSPSLSPSTSDLNSNSNVSMDIVLDQWGKQRTIARDQMRPEIERMVRLHNLIKKQTILVFIANVSTMSIWIGAVIYGSGSFFWETGWDNIVNSICVWMMLTESKRYWNFCRKYGLCWCCYRKTNKVGM